MSSCVATCWEMVRRLRDSGVTIVLTTHYIDEAEQMADRVGVIDKGKIVLVEDKALLMRKLGKAQLLTLTMQQTLATLPAELAPWNLALAAGGGELVYSYDMQAESSGIPALLRQLDLLGLDVKNLQTRQSSLEDIFVNLVHARP